MNAWITKTTCAARTLVLMPAGVRLCTVNDLSIGRLFLPTVFRQLHT